MLKITMIRHGKTKGNSLGKYIGITDEPLLEEEREALMALEFPAVEEVYSSPMKRCIETANILFDNLEPVVVEDLSQCDFGKFEGKTYQELLNDPEYKNWVGSGEITSFPGGENRGQFQERSIRGFEEVIRDAAKKRLSHIAMVVHGGTIMSILDAYGFPPRPYIEWTADTGEGYQIRLNAAAFLNTSNRQIIVDRKIVRS
jgi:alpha-ribazole phosphatase